MQVRNAIVAVTVAAFALTLSACTSDPAPTASQSPAALTPTKIREVSEGFHLESVTATLRSGFPTYADKTDEEIAAILNVACDAMDEKGTPEAGADAIQTFGIDTYDAAFSVSAAIQLYCPEYQSFLGGKTN